MANTDLESGQLVAFRDLCEKAARLGGAELLSWIGRAEVKEKGPGDLVTQADFASQKAIEELVAGEFPDFRFLGEEDNVEVGGNPDSEFCWIVDPLDGTMNYVHQLPSYSVSVALRHRDQIVAGCVFDPWLDEAFVAARGLGASRNGNPIKTSSCSELSKALLVCSFPGRVKRDSVEVERFLRILEVSRSVRRLGSAALNLSYVAAGRLDGYWATSLSVWDMAAGVLLLEEAGGCIRHIGGGPLNLDDPRFVGTCNAELWNQIDGFVGELA